MAGSVAVGQMKEGGNVVPVRKIVKFSEVRWRLFCLGKCLSEGGFDVGELVERFCELVVAGVQTPEKECSGAACGDAVAPEVGRGEGGAVHVRG